MSKTFTPTLNLSKPVPGSNEPFSTSDVNSNWDKIDADAAASHATLGELSDFVGLANAGWTTWTPTITATTTNPNLGTSPTQQGLYRREGNTVHFTAILVCDSGATAGSGNYQFNLPLPRNTGLLAFPSIPIGMAAIVPSGNSMVTGNGIARPLLASTAMAYTLTGTVANNTTDPLAPSTRVIWFGTYWCAD